MLTSTPDSPDARLCPYLCAANIKEEGFDFSVVKEMYFNPSDETTNRLRSGDLLVVEGGSVGVAQIWSGEIERCFIQNALHRVRAGKAVQNNYLKYMLDFARYSGYIDQVVNKATIAHYTGDKLARTPLVLPSVVEQHAIVEFLDQKTAEINSLMDDARRSIELLEEYRRSVISEAVTKGLDPSVPMKDSGVEWIGEIPTHWETVRAKRIVSFLPGYAYKSDDFTEDGVRLMRGINVGIDHIGWEETVFASEETVGATPEYRLSAGDLVVGLDRPWIKSGFRSAVVGVEDVPSYLVQRVAKVIPGDRCSTEFFHAVLQTNLFADSLGDVLTGVSVPHISTDQIGNMLLPLPPIAEQKAILDTLEKTLSEITSRVSKETRLIELLSEYRKSLISEAVTGKFKVPGVE